MLSSAGPRVPGRGEEGRGLPLALVSPPGRQVGGLGKEAVCVASLEFIMLSLSLLLPVCCPFPSFHLPSCLSLIPSDILISDAAVT